MSDYVSLLPPALAAVDSAAEFVRDHTPSAVTSKGDRDMATDVDYAVERMTRDFLTAQVPGVGFVGEEERGIASPDHPYWVLDPIDGTANFLHGIPLYGVSLGLIHNGRPVLGVVALPFLGLRYSAVEGCGAHTGAEPLAVSAVSKLSDAIVSIGDYAVGAGATEKNIRRLAVTAELAARAQRVRMFGAASIDLVWVAEGRTDGCVILSNTTWDMAAGVVIAREAGATVVDIDGSPYSLQSRATIAAPPTLLPELVTTVQRAAAPPSACVGRS